MIAHFALMGDLYQYDPYDTEASLWNSYPWQIGVDNSVGINSSMPAFTMSKMIWSIDDSDSSLGASSAVLGSFSMFASLVLLDQWGNLGSDAGNSPESIPYKLLGVVSGSVLSAESKSTIVIANTYSEAADDTNLVGVNNGAVLSTASSLIIVSHDTYSETADDTNLVGINNGMVLSATSIQN